MMAEHRAAQRFQPAAPAVDAVVRIRPVHVRLLGRMAENARAGPVLEPGEVAGMVQVPVREQNRLQGLRRESDPAQLPPNERHLTEQPRVNHDRAVRVVEQEAATHEAADGLEACRNVAHARVLARNAGFGQNEAESCGKAN